MSKLNKTGAGAREELVPAPAGAALGLVPRPWPAPGRGLLGHGTATGVEAAAVVGSWYRRGQGIQGALYVPVSLRIAVQSSPAQMLLILPSLRR